MKKIIISEGVLVAVRTVDSLFGRGGIRTIPARSSEEVLQLHRRHRADLIVTEFSLPAMGGAGLCREIRGAEVIKDVSIIMVCEPDQTSLAPCQESGANAVLVKPLDPTELYFRISELIAVPQRKDIRVLLKVDVSDRGGGPSFFASSRNVSISGMLLETNAALRKGARLSCSFYIGHAEVVADCEVRRVSKTADGRYLNGVQFINLDTKHLVIIDQFVKNRVKH